MGPFRGAWLAPDAQSPVLSVIGPPSAAEIFQKLCRWLYACNTIEYRQWRPCNSCQGPWPKGGRCQWQAGSLKRSRRWPRPGCLPGRLDPSAKASFRCQVLGNDKDNPFTVRESGVCLRLVIAHRAGCRWWTGRRRVSLFAFLLFASQCRAGRNDSDELSSRIRSRMKLYSTGYPLFLPGSGGASHRHGRAVEKMTGARLPGRTGLPVCAASSPRVRAAVAAAVVVVVPGVGSSQAAQA